MSFWNAIAQAGHDLTQTQKDVAFTWYSNNEAKKAATKAYQRQRALYMLDYNLHTPAQQMANLKAAHLNPNLVYGESNPGSVMSHMPSVSQSQGPTISNHVLGNPMEAFINGQVAGAQIANIKAQQKESESRTNRNIIESMTNLVKYMQLVNQGSTGNSVQAFFTGALRKFADWVHEKDPQWLSVHKNNPYPSKDVPSIAGVQDETPSWVRFRSAMDKGRDFVSDLPDKFLKAGGSLMDYLYGLGAQSERAGETDPGKVINSLHQFHGFGGW